MKKPRATKGVSLYANLSNRRKANKEFKSRKKAEYLASLPKHPVKRLLYRMHPRRFFAYWFSREGAIMALKIFGVSVLLLVLLFGALFAYYRRELDAIRPSEIAKRVSTTVTRYYDRNGVLLWEDKGDGDYKLVVKSEEISKYMKDATVAIEDKDFYQHGGFSITGIARAMFSNSQGGSTQGGSTLTQQLVKQVFLADDANKRGLDGIPRKIKEIILSIEIERMYNKDQILTLYLNESPYGGRRNGVESAAQTYFNKHAKDLTLAESAYLAAIPQNPTTFNPYNTEGHDSLVSRAHTVLDYMADQGKITKAQAEEAKKVAVLDAIQPEADQYKDIKAPHFVQMVKDQLETKLGKKVMGEGGLTIKTTLDWRAQQVVDKAFENLFASSYPARYNFDNGAATMLDTQTGQILAMRGSRDYNYPDYGAVNDSISFIQPGSSIKPFVYANLFKGNYGAGSILSDDALPQSIYRTDDGKSVANFDNKFRGAIPIRSALPESRNIPAIKAMYIGGIQATWNTIHDMGDLSYCTDGVDQQAGLSSSIGGCGVKQVEHANTFATIGRLGVYKPIASVLEVKNAQGQVIDQWKDSSKQAVDPQIAYILADILSDDKARSPSFGAGAAGLNVPGVKTLAKTGTSNLGVKSSNLWMNSVSPKVTLSVYVGNHQRNKAMGSALSSILGPTISTIQHDVHFNIFKVDGTWKEGDWLTEPAGIQRLSVNGRTDLFPSWFNKATATNGGEKISFDKVSKKKATTCTPDAAKIDVSILTATDPVTKQKTYVSTDGYDPNSTDDVHNCADVKPFVTAITGTLSGQITVSVTQGTHPLQTIEVLVDGNSIGSVSAAASGDFSFSWTPTSTGNHTVVANVTDAALYAGTLSKDIAFKKN